MCMLCVGKRSDGESNGGGTETLNREMRRMRMILKQMRGKKPSGKDVDGKDFNCIPKSHQISPSEVVEPLAPRITPQMDEGLFLIL